MDSKLSSPFELIKKSFDIFFDKDNLRYLVLIFIPIIPFQIFQYVRTILPKTNGELLTLAPFVGIAAAMDILYFILYFVVALTSMYAVKNVLDKQKMGIRETYTIAGKGLWKFFLLSVLIFLVVLGGSILLIIPGLIFAVWYSFSRFIYVENKYSIKECMSKSKALVKGRFWKITGRLIIFVLFTGIVGVAISVFPFGIGTYINSLLGCLFLLPYYLLYRELA